MRISDGSSDVCSSDLQGFPNTIEKNDLEVRKSHIRQKPSLVIMNPPFNIDSKTKEYVKANYGGRPLLPEVWFQKALELFGRSVPIAMFTPYGFRLNQTDNSSRWKKFIEGEYSEITSIVSSEEHTSELQSLMRSSYAVFCSTTRCPVRLTP